MTLEAVGGAECKWGAWAPLTFYMGGQRRGCSSGTSCPSSLADPPPNDEGVWKGAR